MLTLFEAGVDILIFIRFLSGFQALFGGFGLVVGGTSIHDTHFMNTVRLLLPEVSDEENPLHLSFIL